MEFGSENTCVRTFTNSTIICLSYLLTFHLHFNGLELPFTKLWKLEISKQDRSYLPYAAQGFTDEGNS